MNAEDRLWKNIGLRAIYFITFLIGILFFINNDMFLFYFFAVMGMQLTVLQIFTCGYELGWEYKRLQMNEEEFEKSGGKGK